MEPKFIAIAVVGLVLLAVLGYFLYTMFMKKDKKSGTEKSSEAGKSSGSSSTPSPTETPGASTTGGGSGTT